VDPVTGRRVAIAPGRAHRPGGGLVPEDECPFEAGREDRTPPETLRIGDEPWQVRVFPNLYPAFERHEVVVHTPNHVVSLADLDDERLALVAEAWRRRRDAEPAGYLHALVNEGREAGASREHTHSQLVWLGDTPPPETQHRVERERWSVVAERDGLVLACPYVSRLPYELVIAPAAPRADAFGDALMPHALVLLGSAVRRLRSVHERAVPFNVWLHDSDDWHIELLPRTSTFAGVELGAGIYVNSTAPEDAAKALRAA
jgi:UDPglucose--hexose-1-phosphate uridylyltransferase